MRSRSLVMMADGRGVQIRELVNQEYRGAVPSLVDGEVRLCKVTGGRRWVRSKNHTFFNVVTPSTPRSCSGNYKGPDLAADHPVITQFGPVPVCELEPGLHRIVTETPTANAEQRSLIVGSLLGDGGFYEQFGGKQQRQNCNTCGLWFSQSAPRLDYVKWKHDSLINLAPGSNCGITPASGRKNEVHRYALNATRYFNYLRLTLPRRTAAEHGHRRLIITDEVFDLLGPIGFAVWYMDDGSVCPGGQAVLTASKLTADEVEVSERRWSEFLGEEIRYNPKAKSFYFSCPAFGAFRERVLPYIHPSVAYKMPGAPTVAYEIDQSFRGLYHEEILKIEEIERIVKDGSNTRFSLEVPESGNFLTMAGFVAC